MAIAIAYPHIVKDNGQPARLERHPRVRVAQIVMDYLAHGWSPEEICNQYPHLQHAEVYAAMTYYHDHRDEIELLIHESCKKAGRFEERPWPLHFISTFTCRGPSAISFDCVKSMC